MRFLLDTNAVSEVNKPRPNAGLSAWLLQRGASCAISELTLGELTKGTWRLPDGRKRNETLAWIEETQALYRECTLPLSRKILRRWGRLCGEHEARGRKLAVMDSLLAATALVHDLTIVTRNTADFPSDVPTLNPWRS
jgi:predicted nucleic acid-binding protein